MFHNTTGGEYKDDGSKVSYTFPSDSTFKINDVNIPLGNMTIECNGDWFDNVTLEHFTNVSSLVMPQKHNTYNTSILILDNDMSKNGYPNRDIFSKYGVEYLSSKEFMEYQNKVYDEGLPEEKLIQIINFLKQQSEDNRQQMLGRIQKIVNENNKFPKNISMIYDYSELMHATHIVLSFETPNECVLHIDNTLSPLFTLLPMLVNNLKINAHECPEKISGDQSRFIELYENNNDKEPAIKLEFTVPVNKMLIEKIYKRMKETLELIGLKIIDVKIHHSSRNQKMTDECVPYSIQNKLDYVTGIDIKSDETARQKGIRLRAEHAVLSYILSGNNFMPRFNEQRAIDSGVKRDIESWYPNFSDVCTQLDESIICLSFNDLNKLYLSLEIDDTNKLSEQFTDLLLISMKNKIPNDEYIPFIDNNIDAKRAQFMERTMSPGVFYNQENGSLFISKTLMFSIKQLQHEKNYSVNQPEENNNIEQEILKYARS